MSSYDESRNETLCYDRTDEMRKQLIGLAKRMGKEAAVKYEKDALAAILRETPVRTAERSRPPYR